MTVPGAESAGLTLDGMLALTGKRRQGFEYMIAHLRSRRQPLVIETGCARTEMNFEGDGMSTLIFDRVVAECAGRLMSVDIDPRHVAFARARVGGRTTIDCADSVGWIASLGVRPDLLYLDSFDFVTADPWPSSVHHMYELAAALRMLPNGSLVAVDDNFVTPGGIIGKGRCVGEYFERTGVPMVYEGYQRIWQIDNRPQPRRARRSLASSAK